MYSKLVEGGGNVPSPVRTSDRLRRRPKGYRKFVYYGASIMRPKKNKPKARASASKIARLLRPGRKPKASVSYFLFFFKYAIDLCC